MLFGGIAGFALGAFPGILLLALVGFLGTVFYGIPLAWKSLAH